jgi:hypothetical protein
MDYVGFSSVAIAKSRKSRAAAMENHFRWSDEGAEEVEIINYH